MDEVEALKSLYPDRVFVVNDVQHMKDDHRWPLVVRVEVPLNRSHDDTEPMVIDAWINDDVDIGSTNNSHLESVIPEQSRPNFERTVSGCRWHTSFNVACLPPVELSVIISAHYPEVAPDFTLSSVLFDIDELESLCKQLDLLSIDNQGIPILSLWVNWLEQEALDHLDIGSCYFLTSSVDGDNAVTDNRVLPLSADVREKIFSVIKNDLEEERKRFDCFEHECSICLDVKIGRDCRRLPQCFHYFCFDCISLYVSTKLKDGKVFLKCPEDSCDYAVPLCVIRDCLPADEYMKWESVALSRALDSMNDIDWCPRCQLPVVTDVDAEKTGVAQCANCYYAFCTKCKDAFHQGTKCRSVEEKLTELKHLSPSTSKQTLSEKEKAARLAKMKMDLLSEYTTRKISKPCPGCGANIQKTEGCNKVTCTICRGYMCWICGKAITGYDHFTGSCNVAGQVVHVIPPQVQPQPAVEYVMMQDQLLRNPNLRSKLARCPVCKQQNLKRERNNHMKCWACRRNFCYICRQPIIGTVTTHFITKKAAASASSCVQHSDN